MLKAGEILLNVRKRRSCGGISSLEQEAAQLSLQLNSAGPGANIKPKQRRWESPSGSGGRCPSQAAAAAAAGGIVPTNASSHLPG